MNNSHKDLYHPQLPIALRLPISIGSFQHGEKMLLSEMNIPIGTLLRGLNFTDVVMTDTQVKNLYYILSGGSESGDEKVEPGFQ